jgi:hypothetical protein
MGLGDQVAQQQFLAADVRFGSKADIERCQVDVRFTPESKGAALSAMSNIGKLTELLRERQIA